MKKLIKKYQTIKQTIQKTHIETYAVILVNSFKLGKKIITKILCDPLYIQIKKQQYIELLHLFNKLGYKTCKKFLGKTSYFIKYFDYVPSSKSKKNKSQLINNSYSVDLKLLEHVLVSKLQKIQILLKGSQTKPQSQSIKVQQQVIPVEQPLEQQPAYQISGLAHGLLNFFVKGNKIDQQIIQMNGWKVQMQLNKIKNQKIGKLQIRCSHVSKKINFTQKISQQKLQKLLHLFNLQDILPYEYSIYQQPVNFISCCIKPFFRITQQGIIQFLPRNKGILNEFLQKQFFSVKCLISFHHVRGNQFRLTFSPCQESGSVYLNIQLNEQSLYQMFDQVIDQVPQKIFKLYIENILSSKKREKHKIKRQQKKIFKVRNFQLIKFFIERILNSFQKFIKNQEDQLDGYDIFYLIQQKSQWLYKYQQNYDKIGTFFRVKYSSIMNCFSVYAQVDTKNQQKLLINQSLLNRGNFQKIKGTGIFGSKDFQELFGFQFQYQKVKNKIKRIEQIICMKYYLNTNQKKKIQTKFSSYDDYCDNFMLQQSFNSHCFKLNFIKDDQSNNYLNPLTATIITLNNQIPLGIKITHYNTQTITNKGYFIHIYSEDWNYMNFVEPVDIQIESQNSSFQQISERSINQSRQIKQSGSKISTQQNLLMIKHYQEKYSFEMQYFIGIWMRKQGFRNILQKVIHQNSSLYLQKNLNTIVNWMKIFQE